MLLLALLIIVAAVVAMVRRVAVAAAAGRRMEAALNALPVVRAMLIGALLALLVAWREIQALTRSLFEGMGSAYGSIISLTITAQCFGAGIAAVGLDRPRAALSGWATVDCRSGVRWATP